MVESKRKVIAIGLDGGTWDLLDRFIDAGFMPNLRTLKENGTYATLLSTCPPATVPAWPSIVTGKNPGAHGIYDFLSRKSDSYEISFVHSSEIMGTPFWHDLGESGIRVGILNIPLTYPPTPVNGFLVSGMMSPRDKGIGYPESFEREIIRKFGYTVSFKSFHASKADFLNDMTHGVELRTKVAVEMLEQGVDFLMLFYKAVDRVQHEFWRELDESYPDHDVENAARVLPSIMDFYSVVDRGIGEIISTAGEDAIVIVFSDHGFGPRYKFVNLNNWLVQKGYLKPSRSIINSFKYQLFRMGFTPKLAFRVLEKVGLGRMRDNVRTKGLMVKLQPKIFFSLHNIDWSQSVAYALGAWGQGISLNVKGREPQGCVEPSEYEGLRDRIIQDLMEFSDGEGNEPVVKAVHKRENIYRGELVWKAPDIVIEPTIGYDCFQQLTFSSKALLEKTYSTTGTHRPEGMFLASGRGIRKGTHLVPFLLYNIAPTVLHLFQLKVPRDMDGEVATEIFDRESEFFQRKVEFREAHQKNQRNREMYSPQEEETIKGRLRDLGYID